MFMRHWVSCFLFVLWVGCLSAPHTQSNMRLHLCVWVCVCVCVCVCLSVSAHSCYLTLQKRGKWGTWEHPQLNFIQACLGNNTAVHYSLQVEVFTMEVNAEYYVDWSLILEKNGAGIVEFPGPNNWLFYWKIITMILEMVVGCHGFRVLCSGKD